MHRVADIRHAGSGRRVPSPAPVLELNPSPTSSANLDSPRGSAGVFPPEQYQFSNTVYETEYAREDEQDHEEERQAQQHQHNIPEEQQPQQQYSPRRQPPHQQLQTQRSEQQPQQQPQKQQQQQQPQPQQQQQRGYYQQRYQPQQHHQKQLLLEPCGHYPQFQGGMDVVLKDLTFRVKGSKGQKKQLLADVTGYFEPRKLSVLMGPSGSGKTTLLDLMAGRKSSGRSKGEVLFAGNKPTRPFLRRFTGYVEQFDTLLPMLTVEEMLMYTAELKRPLGESTRRKRQAVEELLQKLGLTECRGIKIGKKLSKGISGGQAKRTNIGIALITNPRVLMLDEPTSGLDSFTANEVISLLKALASEGTTVVATVHSPTAYAFSLFDSLLMLIRGRVVYFGAGGSSAFDYVRDLPITTATSPYQSWLNEVEWLVDLFAVAERLGQADAFADAYETSELHAVAKHKVEKLMQKRFTLPTSVAEELGVRSATNTPWWWGLLVLIKYRTFHNYTDPAFLAARLGDKVAMGTTIMTLYWGIGGKFTMDNFFNIASVLFMWCMIPAFGAAAFVPSLVLERHLFVRERHDGLYRVATYLIAKMVDEVGVAAVGSVVIAAIVYFGVKLQGMFVVFWLTYFATLCVGISLAYMIAALSPNMDVANAALPTYVGSLAFVTGFLIRFDDMPKYWRWYSRGNPLAYAFTALMTNQFGDVDPKFLGGQTLLEYFGVANQSVWINIGIVWGFFGVLLIITWVILCVRRYERR